MVLDDNLIVGKAVPHLDQCSATQEIVDKAFPYQPVNHKPNPSKGLIRKVFERVVRPTESLRRVGLKKLAGLASVVFPVGLSFKIASLIAVKGLNYFSAMSSFLAPLGGLLLVPLAALAVGYIGYKASLYLFEKVNDL